MHRQRHDQIAKVFTFIALSIATAQCYAEESYCVTFTLMDGNPNGSLENGTLRMLAEPTVMTALGQDVDFHTGGEHFVREQSLKVGTTLRLRLERADGGRVRIKGTLESSNLIANQEDLAAAESIRICFDRTMRVGETAVFRLKDQGPRRQWLEIAIRQGLCSS